MEQTLKIIDEEEKVAKAKKSVEKATSFNKSNSEINDFLEQKSQGSSCLSSAALIALIVGIIPLHCYICFYRLD